MRSPSSAREVERHARCTGTDMLIDKAILGVGSLRLRSASLPGLATLLCWLSGCSDVERQTVDRVRDYDASAFTSPDDCEAVVGDTNASGERKPRIGSWNVRYFPDTEETPAEKPEDGTNVDWLSCAITSLGVDVLAVQEFKRTPRARDAQSELLDRLNQRTGGDWQLELSSCDPEEVQHPGFLYDASRVKGSQFREIPALNPLEVCSNDASPGFGGYFRIEGGPDFHMVAIHFPSGDGQAALDARAQAFAAMPEVVNDARSLLNDDDIVFTGDFNTSGCSECDPQLESSTEIEDMRASFDERENPLHALGADQVCSREDGSNSHLLDHFVIADTMAEVPDDATTHVGGFCADGACDRLQRWHVDARDHLSDHCPILLDLSANDDD